MIDQIKQAFNAKLSKCITNKQIISLCIDTRYMLHHVYYANEAKDLHGYIKGIRAQAELNEYMPKPVVSGQSNGVDYRLLNYRRLKTVCENVNYDSKQAQQARKAIKKFAFYPRIITN